MGLFDEITKQVADAARAFAKGDTPPLAQDFLSLLQSRGGIDELVRKFQEQGFGDVVASWISTGPNQAISPEQLASILDPEQLRTLSQQAGIAMARLPEALATLLPTLIDGLTPDGEVPGPSQLLRMVAAVLRGERGD